MTLSQVLEAKRMRRSGEKVNYIAAVHRVSPTTIKRALANPVS